MLPCHTYHQSDDKIVVPILSSRNTPLLLKQHMPPTPAAVLRGQQAALECHDRCCNTWDLSEVLSPRMLASAFTQKARAPPPRSSPSSKRPQAIFRTSKAMSAMTTWPRPHPAHRSGRHLHGASGATAGHSRETIEFCSPRRLEYPWPQLEDCSPLATASARIATLNRYLSSSEKAPAPG